MLSITPPSTIISIRHRNRQPRCKRCESPRALHSPRILPSARTKPSAVTNQQIRINTRTQIKLTLDGELRRAHKNLMHQTAKGGIPQPLETQLGFSARRSVGRVFILAASWFLTRLPQKNLPPPEGAAAAGGRLRGMKYQSPRFSLFKAEDRVYLRRETQFFTSDYEREGRRRGRLAGGRSRSDEVGDERGTGLRKGHFT